MQTQVTQVAPPRGRGRARSSLDRSRKTDLVHFSVLKVLVDGSKVQIQRTETDKMDKMDKMVKVEKVMIGVRTL